MSQEEEKQRALEDERRNSQAEKERVGHQKDARKSAETKSSVKKIVKNVISAASLSNFTESRDIFFKFAIMLALLKDIIDIGIIGTLLTPLVFIVTIAAMLVCGSGNPFAKRKAFMLLAGNLVELIPILSLLPAEVFSVVIIYIFILKERRAAHEKQSQAAASISEAYA